MARRKRRDEAYEGSRCGVMSRDGPAGRMSEPWAEVIASNFFCFVLPLFLSVVFFYSSLSSSSSSFKWYRFAGCEGRGEI